VLGVEQWTEVRRIPRRAPADQGRSPGAKHGSGRASLREVTALWESDRAPLQARSLQGRDRRAPVPRILTPSPQIMELIAALGYEGGKTILCDHLSARSAPVSRRRAPTTAPARSCSSTTSSPAQRFRRLLPPDTPTSRSSFSAIVETYRHPVPVA
jgi:hypothetical protein